MAKIKYRKTVDPLWGLLHLTPLPWGFLFHAGPTSTQAEADKLLLRGAQLSVFVYISRRLAKANQGSLEIPQSLIVKDTGYKESAVQEAIAALEEKNRIWATGTPPNKKAYMLGDGPYPGFGTKKPQSVRLDILMNPFFASGSERAEQEDCAFIANENVRSIRDNL